MTRLQKKCLVAATGTHLLLVVVVFAAAAIHSKPELTEAQLLDFIPTTLLDVPSSSSGTAAPVMAQPARTPNNPPSIEHSTPVLEPRSHPPAHESVATSNETPVKPAKSKPLTDKTSTTPRRRRPIADFSTRVTLGGKKPAIDSEPMTTATSTSSSMKSASDAIQTELAATESHIRGRAGKPTLVELPGDAVSDESFAGYNDYIFKAYYGAWRTPAETTKLAAVDVKIVVERDGTVVTSKIVSESGDSALDRSVQRALDQVKQLHAFPSGAKEDRRTFTIRFNLEAKQSSG